MKRIIVILISGALVGIFLYNKLYKSGIISMLSGPVLWWQVQSIDTMKFSRDLSREKLNDPSFDKTIASHMRIIKQTGATHVAIGTPYDSEFLPILKRWVLAARRNNLKVWFRGNFSGWEGWFDYKPITPQEHILKIKEFIVNNGSIFEDGDIFTTCTECENGILGDPRHVGSVTDYRSFLISDYISAKDAFEQINKNVAANYFSMNGDVANLIMDKATTNALDGIVVIDHYTESVDKLVSDIRNIAQKSGGKVVLGEFGAPIPDIHGEMDENQQAMWINEAMTRLIDVESLVGINYWVSIGGSTQLWADPESPRVAVSVINNFYKPKVIKGILKNNYNRPIANALISINYRSALTNKRGEFQLPVLDKIMSVRIKASGYDNALFTVEQNDNYLQITLGNNKNGLIPLLYSIIDRMLPN